MSLAKLYINPRCSTCRNAAAHLDEHSFKYEKIEYLKVGLNKKEIMEIKSKLGAASVRDFMRIKEETYKELSLSTADEATLVDSLIEHPVLLQRPIIVDATKALIGRPSERILEFVKS